MKMPLKSMFYGVSLLLFLTIIYIGVFRNDPVIIDVFFENITNIISKIIANNESKLIVNENIKSDYENLIFEEPLIYIYNTHEVETYSKEGYEELNITPSVKDASFLLQKYLKEEGIESVVEENSFMDILNANSWAYDQLYKVSRIYLENALKRYENIKLYIDLHRDSIKKSNSTVTIDGQKYAKILFVVGVSHPNYEENLKVAQELNEIITKNANISRGILKKTSATANGIYNQDLNENIVLIEVGAYQNTYSEVDNTLKVLAKSIKDYINE